MAEHTVDANMELTYWSLFLALAVGAVCWTASRWLASKHSGEQQFQNKLGKEFWSVVRSGGLYAQALIN